MLKYSSSKANPLSLFINGAKVILQRFTEHPKKAAISPAKFMSSEVARRRNSTITATRPSVQSVKSRRIFRINLPRTVIALGCLVAAVGISLLVALNGDKPQTAMQDNSLTALDTINETDSSPPAQLASISVVMPVSESIRITQGVNALVVSEVQTRLMELGYMDVDETDDLFDAPTTEAVNRFKIQLGLEPDGIVDEQTYTLLFSEDAQVYTLSIGAESTDVYELQQRLIELGYMDTATGYFGTETELAVIKFQKLNFLTEDGKIGKSMCELLYSPDVIANIFTYGEESDEILACQERLKKLGYLTTQPDGRFGPDTKAAIQRFQDANGLIADGNLGPATRTVLMSDNAKSSALCIGSRGVQVTTIQERLKALGYLSRVTGYFGSDTESAVRKFQRRNGLTQDGRVGPNTISVLMSPRAKKASTSSSGSGSGSGSGTTANITGANVESFISVAESKLGCEYTGGAKGPNAFDCSGFVYWCLNQVGVHQGYLTSHAWPSCTKYTKITSISDLQRGDIIIYSGHCAIALGDGYQIDASSHYDKVVKRKVLTGIKFVCAFRVF